MQRTSFSQSRVPKLHSAPNSADPSSLARPPSSWCCRHPPHLGEPCSCGAAQAKLNRSELGDVNASLLPSSSTQREATATTKIQCFRDTTRNQLHEKILQFSTELAYRCWLPGAWSPPRTRSFGSRLPSAPAQKFTPTPGASARFLSLLVHQPLLSPCPRHVKPFPLHFPYPHPELIQLLKQTFTLRRSSAELCRFQLGCAAVLKDHGMG